MGWATARIYPEWGASKRYTWKVQVCSSGKQNIPVLDRQIFSFFPGGKNCRSAHNTTTTTFAVFNVRS